ncbi:iron ABC transporter permease [Corynebacterium auris]|uniref:iron ABC transporter permease n=1 Tax=Corynebacterium auris TaxID=44750 RepID=UPI0025B5C05F|nr:iron ABC transporter permease [Corynebacterium auris]
MNRATDALRAQRRERRAKQSAAGVVFALAAGAAYLILLGQGAVSTSPGRVVEVLTGGGTAREIMAVWDLRIPVALATLIVGAALGMAGAWTQSMSRNPLASPDILGVTSGAAVAVVLGSISYRPSFVDDIPIFWWRAVLALVGAVAVVVVLSLLGGIGTSNRIVLVGVALTMMLQAGVSYLLLRAELLRAAEAQTWLAGSTGFIRMDAILPLLLGLAPFVALGLWCGRDLPLLAHDDASAAMLGVNITMQRRLLLVAATGVSAVVVAAVGPIGFVALIAPHFGRLVAQTPVPPPLVAALAGAAILAVCAVIAGLIPSTAPVGAVSAVVGGIVLVVLVWRRSGR